MARVVSTVLPAEDARNCTLSASGIGDASTMLNDGTVNGEHSNFVLPSAPLRTTVPKASAVVGNALGNVLRAVRETASPPL